jgi:FkbM family methyltransferase
VTGTACGPSVRSDLIFDVGLHKGEDSAYYLRKGFRVVAIEANPNLIEENHERFFEQVKSGKINILHGAIAREAGTVRFFVDALSVWGTIDPRWADRNKTLRSSNQMIEVPTLDIRSVFQSFGIPHYLKLDIEGREDVVLDAMLDLPAQPTFVSMESEKVSFRKLLWELRRLRELGYSRFKIIQQNNIPGSSISTTAYDGERFSYTFEEHATGPFGDDLPGRWLTLRQACVRYVWIFAQYRLFGDDGWIFRVKGGRRIYEWLKTAVGKQFPGWYDTHAAR